MHRVNDMPDPDAGVDPVIVDVVTTVRDRFGASGLRELIDLAHHELGLAEAALRELSPEEP
jgi:hypothetical protein